MSEQYKDIIRGIFAISKDMHNKAVELGVDFADEILGVENIAINHFLSGTENGKLDNYFEAYYEGVITVDDLIEAVIIPKEGEFR